VRSRFNSPLQIVGDAVKAGGALEWAPGETWVIVMVSITQKDEKVAGAAKSRYGSQYGQWSLDISPETEKKFKNGTARAAGMVCAYGDAVSVFQWEQEIQLEKVS
jgi:hypothetical protein